jgi:hypothetical protein
MSKHVCSRCRRLEVIPTHQVVRFDASVHALCRDCWQAFRAWFYAGDRIGRFEAPPPVGGTEPEAA